MVNKFFIILLFVSIYSCQNDLVDKKDQVGVEDFDSTVIDVRDTGTYVKSYYVNSILKEEYGVDTNYNLHGMYREYNKDGNLIVDLNYYHGKRKGKQYIWNGDGFLSTEANFKNDKKNGPQYSFYNGDTLSISYYRDGILLEKKVSENYYEPPKELMEKLLDDGLDSLTALNILKNNLFGQIIETDSGVIFIEIEEDSSKSKEILNPRYRAIVSRE
jgi:antitoxin component YwqK of YwqJK toxin-antitoxin module